MTDRPPTSSKAIFQAVEIGKQAGLQHVYSGNIRGGNFEHTWCPQCQTCLITRVGFMIAENQLHNGTCPECATAIAGIWKK
jgi:pyruvate formate lyase activating enzyme